MNKFLILLTLVLVVVGIGFYAYHTLNPDKTTACYDSDGGPDEGDSPSIYIATPGFIEENGVRMNDSCVASLNGGETTSGEYIRERSCNSSGHTESHDYKCADYAYASCQTENSMASCQIVSARSVQVPMVTLSPEPTTTSTSTATSTPSR